MADSILTTLLENIEVNLRDTTNFSDLAALSHTSATVHVAPVFLPLMLAPPYVVVVPGDAEIDQTESRRDLQQIEFHVVHGILSSDTQYFTTLGTASTAGILTLMEDIEAALVRPKPYGHAPYNTGSYTALNTVHSARALTRSKIDLTAAPFVEGIFAKQVLTLEYWIEKGT